MISEDEREECSSCGKPVRPGDTHGITFSNEDDVKQVFGDLCEECAFQIQEIANEFINGSGADAEILEEVRESLERAETKIETARENLEAAERFNRNPTNEDDAE